MGVAVLHLLASDQRRGAETFGLALHRELLQRGHESSVRAITKSAQDGTGLGVGELGRRRFSWSGLRALRRQARASDVVVAHGSSTLLACAIGLIGLRTPFVYVSIGDPRHWAATSMRRLRVATLLRRATRVVAICDPAKEILARHYRLPEDRIIVIPNGRSGERFRPRPHGSSVALRLQLGIDDQVALLGFVGALKREKRPDVAIRSVALLTDAHLAVVGAGVERAETRALAQYLAPGRVHFLGSTDQIEDFLADVDVVLMTSDSEGVPGVLIEAGLSGVPVVASDVGWIDQVVVDGRTGLLVPPGRPELVASACRHVLAERRRMGSAARQHCEERFELRVVVAQWERLLEQVGCRPSVSARD